MSHFMFYLLLVACVLLVCLIIKAISWIRRGVGMNERDGGWPIHLIIFPSLAVIVIFFSCFKFIPGNSILLSDIDGIHNAVVRVSPKFEIVPAYKLPKWFSIRSTTGSLVKVVRYDQTMKVRIISFTSRNLCNLTAIVKVKYSGDPANMIATIHWGGDHLEKTRSTLERTIVEFYQERDFLGTESERDDLHALIESKFPEELNIRCTFLEIRRQ